MCGPLLDQTHVAMWLKIVLRGVALLVYCEKKHSVEMCHPVCVRKLFIQRYCRMHLSRLRLCLTSRCTVVGFFYAVVAFCMRLPCPSVWEAMIHCAWLIPLQLHLHYFTRDANSHWYPLIAHTVLQLGPVKIHHSAQVFLNSSRRLRCCLWRVIDTQKQTEFCSGWMHSATVEI